MQREKGFASKQVPRKADIGEAGAKEMKKSVFRGMAYGSPTTVLKRGNMWLREKEVGVLCLRVVLASAQCQRHTRKCTDS